MTERTLSIIKPNITARNKTGEVIARLEQVGLKVVAQKRVQLSQQEAEGFYEEHKERPFFSSLVGFMTSGPVVLMVLEADNAVKANRDIMGATNPDEAAQGTIRKDYGESIEANAVHGSDSQQSAAREISYFFKDEELVG